MRFQNYLEEEYFTRFSKWEIFTNPSRKEITDIEKQSKEQGTDGFIRFLLTKDMKTLYAFPSSMLHGNAALVIDERNGTDLGRNYEEHYYPLEGFWDYKGNEGVMFMKPSVVFHPTEEQDEEITKVMKEKFNIKIKMFAHGFTKRK